MVGSKKARAGNWSRRWIVGARRRNGASAPTSNTRRILYIYFWRWATWKVFGSGHYAATGIPDKDEEGIVCFITVAGLLNGSRFFEKMREDLRQTCSEIWVVDCSPEGHQPNVPTCESFQGVQQPVCHRAIRRPANSARATISRRGSRFRPCRRGRARKNSRRSPSCRCTVPTGRIVQAVGAIRSYLLPLALGRRFRR